MFWLGGASAKLAASTASFVLDSIAIYPAVDGSVSIVGAVDGSAALSPLVVGAVRLNGRPR